MEQRTKVDALKDLGEKVTGTNIGITENETIVEMLDKITANYNGGGSSGGNTLIYKINTNLYNYNPDEPNPIAITDDQDIETLETIIENFGENKLIFFYFIVDNIPHYRFIESAKETEINFYAYSYTYLGTFEKIEGNWQYMQYA